MRALHSTMFSGIAHDSESKGVRNYLITQHSIGYEEGALASDLVSRRAAFLRVGALRNGQC